MNSLTMKQKIILGIIVGAMLIVIGVYGYISLNGDEGELDISGIVNNEIITNSQEESSEVENQNKTNGENDVNFSEEDNQNSRTG